MAMATTTALPARTGVLGRLRNLVSGWLGSWVRDREAASPRAVYEQAIAQRVRRYGELKDAVAGILFLRNKLEGEILERRAELARLAGDAQRAVRRGDDALAVSVVRHRQGLEDDLARAERDLGALRDEAESAKENLLRFREEIRALEREKGRALAIWAGAQARRQVRAVLDGLSVEADVRALDALREHIARLATEAQLDVELDALPAAAEGAEPGLRERLSAIRADARDEAARREVEELKRRLRPAVQGPVPSPVAPAWTGAAVFPAPSPEASGAIPG